MEFVYEDKSYRLEGDKCAEFYIDEETPIEGIDVELILSLMAEGGDKVAFTNEYFDLPCSVCKAGVAEKAKFFNFLEYHFFVFTKAGRYVMSGLSKEYENTTFTRLTRKGTVDDSHMVSVTVCPVCGDYSIAIEQCEL